MPSYMSVSVPPGSPSGRSALSTELPTRSQRSSELAERAFERTSGAPLVQGNSVRVLKDARENYPAWLAAIERARRTVFFENYIIEEDEVGRRFAEALASKAREGVKVLLLRDWVGSRSTASSSFWRGLEAAGVQLRVFNPFRLTSPFGWVSRDHRKMLSVDGDVSFVSGLCVSQRWDTWRDTGVEVRGPAVACVERAFAQVWGTTGAALDEALLTPLEDIPRAGDVALRVVASEPESTDLFRLDQMIAAAAQRTLWLTDAYFVGFAPYVQALRAAAQAGVDVRLLVPSTSDLPLLSPLSRAGYRPLLEAGVRIYEWNGPMIHAKSATADGRWARVGSTNLNLASFIGNYELDVAIEDEGVARALEADYLEDLSHSTEILLTPARRLRAERPRSRRPHSSQRHRPRVGVYRFARAVRTAAASGTRVLGAVETGIERALALTLVGLAAVGILWPRVLAWPLSVAALWFAFALALRHYRRKRRR